jgi:hypothetical protein
MNDVKCEGLVKRAMTRVGYLDKNYKKPFYSYGVAGDVFRCQHFPAIEKSAKSLVSQMSETERNPKQ